VGWLIDLLTFPFMGPVKGVVWIAEKITEQADKELYSEEAVRGKLVELELRYDLGEISEEEYLEGEESLLRLLRAARERQEAEQEE
jgi:hypothetical protein